jgi:hypothetical protein
MNHRDAPRTRKPLKGYLMTYVVAVLAIAIGVAAVVAGEADDSPGLQLMGVVLVIGGIAVGVRTARRSR